METKKAYGVVTAIGTKLGERARTDDALLGRLRAAPDITTFGQVLALETEGLLPPALVTTFVEQVLTEADWVQWRARVLIQAKLIRDGKERVPGHEAGRGVGRP